MDNYYDPIARAWVTDGTRFAAVLAEPQFAPIREYDSFTSAPERTWALILELLEAVPSDTVALVGAGPLESFIHQYGGAFIEPILHELEHNHRLREAIANVNIARGTLPAAIETRLQVASGPHFQFLDTPPSHEG